MQYLHYSSLPLQLKPACIRWAFGCLLRIRLLRQVSALCFRAHDQDRRVWSASSLSLDASDNVGGYSLGRHYCGFGIISMSIAFCSVASQPKSAQIFHTNIHYVSKPFSTMTNHGK
jgi:hypothetical protein